MIPSRLSMTPVNLHLHGYKADIHENDIISNNVFAFSPKMTTSPWVSLGKWARLKNYDRLFFYGADGDLREIRPGGMAEEDEPWKEEARIVAIRNNIAIEKLVRISNCTDPLN